MSGNKERIKALPQFKYSDYNQRHETFSKRGPPSGGLLS